MTLTVPVWIYGRRPEKRSRWSRCVVPSQATATFSFKSGNESGDCLFLKRVLHGTALSDQGSANFTSRYSLKPGITNSPCQFSAWNLGFAWTKVVKLYNRHI